MKRATSLARQRDAPAIFTGAGKLPVATMR